MRAALRRNEDGRIDRASAEVVLTVWTGAEVGRVAIQAHFSADFENVACGRPGKVLSSLEEIAERRHHRARGGVECLVKAIGELERWIRVVRRGERRRRARDAQRRFPQKARRNGSRIGKDDVALPVHILHAEAGIDRRLIGIGRRSRKVVVVEAREELSLFSELLIQADRKLIGIGGHLRRNRVGPRLIGTGGIVRQRIARQHGCNLRIDRHRQRIGAAIGVGDGVESGTLGSGRHRKYLRGAQYLAEALILTEIKGLSVTVIQMRKHHRTAVGEAEFIATERRNASRLRDRRMIEVVARVEGRVADKLED